jgi:hypothetical protein
MATEPRFSVSIDVPGDVDGFEDRHGAPVQPVDRAPGLHVTGHHSVEPTANGSRATLAPSYERFFGNLFARMTEGYYGAVPRDGGERPEGSVGESFVPSRTVATAAQRGHPPA